MLQQQAQMSDIAITDAVDLGWNDVGKVYSDIPPSTVATKYEVELKRIWTTAKNEGPPPGSLTDEESTSPNEGA